MINQLFFKDGFLCAAGYIVEVDQTTLPPGFVPSPSDRGGNDTLDSDGSPVYVFLPTDSTSNPTVDFGFNTPATGRIGDFIFNDLNRNGIQDAGEPGIDGVMIQLRDSLGQIIATTTSIGPFGNNGFYEFTGLTAGTYTVTVDGSTLPPGFVSSAANQGGNPALDSNPIQPPWCWQLIPATIPRSTWLQHTVQRQQRRLRVQRLEP